MGERMEREGSYKKQICILGNSYHALILIYDDIFLIFHAKLWPPSPKSRHHPLLQESHIATKREGRILLASTHPSKGAREKSPFPVRGGSISWGKLGEDRATLRKDHLSHACPRIQPAFNQMKELKLFKEKVGGKQTPCLQLKQSPKKLKQYK